ncbi:acetylglutamate kinase [Salmonella enterica subsp. enterica]|nr:acetylglutamate kinase [Salmonella enterica subsp. enterica]
MTPADQIGIITGALAGTANKTLLAWAKKHHIASVGLFLGDGDSVNVTQLDEALGHVGLAQPGSPKLINMLLENGFLPVVSSIGVTDDGQLMNVNADQAATALAATLGADLILLSDVSGILDGKGQRIAEMTASKAEQLIDQGHYYRRDDCESECGSRCCAGAGAPGGYRFLASCGATAGAV